MASPSAWAANSGNRNSITNESNAQGVNVSLQSFLEALGLSKHLTVFQNEELDMEVI